MAASSCLVHSGVAPDVSGPELESPDDHAFCRSDCFEPAAWDSVDASLARRSCQSLSGLIGNSLISMSNGARASHSAFVKAPGTGPGIPSPIPREPSGVCGQVATECLTSTC